MISDRTIQTLSREEKKNEASKANQTNVDVAAEFNKATTDTNLFEPPGNNNKAEPQKFKKGNLKLTQDDKGNWKIEENLDQNAENNNKVTVCKNNQIKSVSNTYQVFILNPIICQKYSHI